MAYRPKKSGIVEVRSLNFPPRAQWHIDAVPDKPERDWAELSVRCYVGSGKKYPLTKGICGRHFSGAGFKGFCMVLIDLAFEESINERVTSEYRKEFPPLEGNILYIFAKVQTE